MSFSRTPYCDTKPRASTSESYTLSLGNKERELYTIKSPIFTFEMSLKCQDTVPAMHGVADNCCPISVKIAGLCWLKKLKSKGVELFFDGPLQRHGEWIHALDHLQCKASN